MTLVIFGTDHWEKMKLYFFGVDHSENSMEFIIFRTDRQLVWDQGAIAHMKILMQLIMWAKSVLRFEIVSTCVSERGVACRNLRFGLP